LEEAYELLEAIEALPVVAAEAGAEAIAHLEEELGDVLFQVFFHATLAAEEGWFTVADVARTVHDKLVGRHPHVFGTVQAETAGEVMANWEEIKKAEKGRASVMDGIPAHLPALLYAHKVQRKAATVGFDWPALDGHGVSGADNAAAKVAEELAELQAELRADLRAGVAPAGASASAAAPAADQAPAAADEARAIADEAPAAADQAPAAADEAPAAADQEAVADELGDLLFSCVNLARHLGQDPEAALRGAAAKFRRRFTAVERLAAERGLDLRASDLAVLDGLWDEVKAATG
jgi:uncharacterized protein YabN with tetrapyrrole methylase and pyrophosphatase domain